MELTIYAPDGTELYTMPEIYTDCVERAELMSEDSIELHFSLAEPVYFPVGAHCEWNGKRYEVTEAQSPSYNQSTGGYDNTLTLDAYYMAWKQRIFKYFPDEEGVGNTETSFNFTASLAEHAKLICRCLAKDGYTFNGAAITYKVNRTDGDKLGESKSLAYDGENYIDALNSIADEWDTEWWVVDGVINFGKCETGDAVDFQIGKNVVTMSGSKGSGEYANRLYAFGSDRNIPANYGKGDAVFTITEIRTVNGRTFVKTDHDLKVTYFRKALRNKEFNEAVDMTVAVDEKYSSNCYNVANVLPHQSSGSTTTSSVNATAEVVSDGTASGTVGSSSGAVDATDGTESGGTTTVIGGTTDTTDSTDSGGGSSTIGGTTYTRDTINSGTGGTITIIGGVGSGNGWGHTQIIDTEKKPISLDEKRCYWCHWFPKAEFKAPALVAGTNKIVLPKDRKRVCAVMRVGHLNKTSGSLNITGTIKVILRAVARAETSTTTKKTNLVEFGNTSYEEQWENYKAHTDNVYTIAEPGYIGYYGDLETGEGNPAYFYLGYVDVPEFELQTDDYVVMNFVFYVENGTNAALSFDFGFAEQGKTEPLSPYKETFTFIRSLYLSTQARYENVSARMIYLSGKKKGNGQDALLYSGLGTDGLDEGMWLRLMDGTTPAVGDTFKFKDIVNGALPSYYFPNSLENLKVIKAIAESRLALPSPYRIDARENLSDCEVVEAVYEDEDIYPRTEAEVVDVQTKEFNVTDANGNTTDEKYPSYYIKTDAFEFDEEYQLDNGDNMQIIFQTGALAGLTFDCYFDSDDISVFDSEGVRDGQYFKILRGEFDGGLMLPNTAMRPRSAADYEADNDTTHYDEGEGRWIGDKFILTGWNTEYLPDLGLIEKAQEELREEAELQLAKMSEDPTTYECTMFPDTSYGIGEDKEITKPSQINTDFTPGFAVIRLSDTAGRVLTDGSAGTLDAGKAQVFGIGQRVTLYNRAFFADGKRDSRILGYERKMDIPWDAPVYSVGMKSIFSRMAKIETEVKEQGKKDGDYTRRVVDRLNVMEDDNEFFVLSDDKFGDAVAVRNYQFMLYVPRTGYKVEFNLDRRKNSRISLPFVYEDKIPTSMLNKTYHLRNANADYDLTLLYPLAMGKNDTKGSFGTYILKSGASVAFESRAQFKPRLWVYYDLTE